MKIDFARMTRNFLLGERRDAPSLRSYIQSVSEALSSIRPKSRTEQNRVEVAKQHMREVRRLVRKLEDKILDLESKLEEK